MKILHVGKYYPPFRGGMETVLQNLAEGLLDAGCDVSLVTAGSGAVDAREVIKGPASGRTGSLTRAAVQATISSQPLSAGLIGLLRREIELRRPDLVQLHLPNPLAAAAWLGLTAGSSSGLPPMSVWYHADITRQKFGRRLVQPVISSCLARAVGVCVSSESLRSRSPILAKHRAKVCVVPFGIAPEPWHHILPRRDGAFLFIGRLVSYKGVDVLLNALAAVPRARLTLVGEGPEAGSLRSLAENLGIADRVEFAGNLDDAGIVRCLESALALVLPSVDASEAFGMVQLEAMAAGVPVVATDLPTGVPEVGVAGKTGLLVTPGDEESLARALTKLQAGPEYRRELGEAGRSRFAAEFTRERMIERLLGHYGEMVSRATGRKDSQ